MPLRTQHQITETIKECLPRRGKYILAMVDKQMCEQLRSRLFMDVKDGNFKNLCLDVIEQLKLEADILYEKNYKYIREVQDRWTEQEADASQEASPDGKKEDGLEGKTVIPVLAKADQEIEQFDEEAMTNMKNELMKNIDNINFSLETKLTSKLDAQLSKNKNEMSKMGDRLKGIEN